MDIGDKKKLSGRYVLGNASANLPIPHMEMKNPVKDGQSVSYSPSLFFCALPGSSGYCEARWSRTRELLHLRSCGLGNVRAGGRLCLQTALCKSNRTPDYDQRRRLEHITAKAYVVALDWREMYILTCTNWRFLLVLFGTDPVQEQLNPWV